MSKKLRIGVIGLGTFVEIGHMPTYFDSPYSELLEVAALCDLDEERLAQHSAQWNVRSCYTDVSEMLAKEHLDAVSVVTPDHTHTGPLKN